MQSPFASFLRVAWVVMLLSPPASASAGEASCPVAPSQSAAAGLAMAPVTRAMRRGDGISLRSESTGPYDPQAAAQRREAERQTFERILVARPLLPAAALSLSITPQQRESIEQGNGGGRLRVGTALAIGQKVDFASVDTPALARGDLAFARGVLREHASVLVWEIEVVSVQASALRLQFSDIWLAPGVELYVYDENGRVVGPYAGKGPDGSGEFWSNSVFGDRVRVHLRAPDLAALQTSRFVLAQAMHFGSRYRIADTARQRYVVGPSPDGGSFCGTVVPACTLDGMCALETNPGLANAVKGIAHLQFMDGPEGFICSGTLLNTAFAGPSSEAGTAAGRPLYLLTANHCISSQPSAASLEAYFQYHTASCEGSCPSPSDPVEVDGGTLLTTGAAPTLPDFSLLRLPVPPVGAGLVRLGWTSETVGEGWYLMHLSHPNGAPLAYSYRRARLNNPNLPHCPDAPEPAFLYSGLAPQSAEAAGAVSSGSSGSAALSFLDDFSDVQVVGQLFGHCPDGGDVCNANTDATVDGSFRAAFPYLQRYLLDRIFMNGFDGG